MVKSKPKIAIIEDEPAICEMYRLRLEMEGFEVAIAHNGKEGLELIKAVGPALILLDLRMPVMSGDEMLEKLRETDWGADVRVVILTNISRDEAPHSLRFLDVDRYVVKAHHTPAHIVQIVTDVLDQ